MGTAHLKFWPAHAERTVDVPRTHLFYNLEVSARRQPGKAAFVYYDNPLSFEALRREAELLAGFLQRRCQVARGDRVLLYMQNSLQFVIAYYAILRADAVVVPLNPMCLTEELSGYARDCGARVALLAQELYPRAAPLAGSVLQHTVVATYSDYLKAPSDLAVPEFVRAARLSCGEPGVVSWQEALAAGLEPAPYQNGPDDLAVMPYTSGTTGEPKGCMHTHGSTMYTAVASMQWFQTQPEFTLLALAPFFHVTGMQGSMNGPVYLGNTVVILPRWDRDAAARCVQRYRIAGWTAVPTMIQDFFANPDLARYDLSSIRRLSGGGAAMPAAVAQRLLDSGVTYVEGYGLSETISPTHINPPQRAKQQCLGIPIYGVESRVVDPQTLAELPPGEVGEILIHGPQLMRGYWNKPAATEAALVDIGGQRFLRTGDLGYVDEEGYFFMVDRLKRMINASGYKVWPSEVETFLYRHPAVREACVIAARDEYRGETVKAVVVLRDEWRGRLDEQGLVAWCREHMAAYKVPRRVAFVTELPKSGSGKIQWRALQEREFPAST